MGLQTEHLTDTNPTTHELLSMMCINPGLLMLAIGHRDALKPLVGHIGTPQ
jgi:hypothetical protein